MFLNKYPPRKKRGREAVKRTILLPLNCKAQRPKGSTLPETGNWLFDLQKQFSALSSSKGPSFRFRTSFVRLDMEPHQLLCLLGDLTVSQLRLLQLGMMLRNISGIRDVSGNGSLLWLRDFWIIFVLLVPLFEVFLAIRSTWIRANCEKSYQYVLSLLLWSLRLVRINPQTCSLGCFLFQLSLIQGLEESFEDGFFHGSSIYQKGLITQMPFDENLWACWLGEGSHTLAVAAPRAGRTELSLATEVIQPSQMD